MLSKQFCGTGTRGRHEQYCVSYINMISPSFLEGIICILFFLQVHNSGQCKPLSLTQIFEATVGNDFHCDSCNSDHWGFGQCLQYICSNIISLLRHFATNANEQDFQYKLLFDSMPWWQISVVIVQRILHFSMW